MSAEALAKVDVPAASQALASPPLAAIRATGEALRSPEGEGGAVAQLGERLLCKQEVTGSIPVGSTKSRPS